MNDNEQISFDLKQKIMSKSDIIDSVYMYLMEVNYDETNMKDFISKYLEKIIKPIHID